MALIRKIGEIEVYEIDKDLSKFTRKEREKIVNELFKTQYVGKEISYLLKDTEIHAAINSDTKNNFKVQGHNGLYIETKTTFKVRQDIAASGDYLNLISNAKYQSTNKELKSGQNSKHSIDNKWHNFNKEIIFNGVLYKLIINIREYNYNFYIHNTKLIEK